MIKALPPLIDFTPGAYSPAFFEWGVIRLHYIDNSEDNIVYYFSGKNPLIFTINGRLYLRGGPGNPNLRKEHSEIYGVDEEAISEAGALSGLLKQSAELEANKEPEPEKGSEPISGQGQKRRL